MNSFWKIDVEDRGETADVWFISEDRQALKFDGSFKSKEEKLQAAIKMSWLLNSDRADFDEVVVPIRPNRELLVSMATRYRHDFGLDKDPSYPLSGGFTEAERESLLRQMETLYYEATGQGFYKFKS